MIADRRTITHKQRFKIKLTYTGTKIKQRVRLTMAELEHVGGIRIPLLTPIATAGETLEQ
jgi:hypothetical protein